MREMKVVWVQIQYWSNITKSILLFMCIFSKDEHLQLKLKGFKLQTSRCRVTNIKNLQMCVHPTYSIKSILYNPCKCHNQARESKCKKSHKKSMNLLKSHSFASDADQWSRLSEARHFWSINLLLLSLSFKTSLLSHRLYNYPPVIAFQSSITDFPPLFALSAKFSKRFLWEFCARVFMAWQNFTTTAKLWSFSLPTFLKAE